MLKRSKARGALVVSVLSAVVALGLNGCNAEDQESIAPSTQPPPAVGAEPASPGLREAQYNALQARVYCRHPEECHPSVAMVVSVHEGLTRQCTGFLVGNDTVVTSSHCLPEELRGNNITPCNGRMRVLFPAIGDLPEAEANCKQVLSASKAARVSEVPSDLDYVFVQLEKPIQRKKLAISARGMADHEVLRVITVDPVFNTYPVGEMTAKTCKSIHGSLYFPQYRDAFNPVASLGDCLTEQGNAGAPAIDQSGQVKALIHAAHFKKKDIGTKLAPLASRLTLSEFSYATNLACVVAPGDALAKSLPNGCSAVLPGNQPSSSDDQADEEEVLIGDEPREARHRSLENVDNAFKAWRGTRSKIVEWTYDPVNTITVDAQKKNVVAVRKVTPIPTCYKTPGGTNGWMNSYWSAWGGYPASAEAEIDIKIWKSTTELNSYLQIRDSSSESGLMWAKMQFNCEHIDDLQSTEFSLKTGPLGDGSFITHSISKIGLCPGG